MIGPRAITAVGRVGRVLVVSGFVLLHACASYEPHPLTAAPALVSDVSHITVDTSRLRLPRLAKHVFDPADGLDMTEVATLAVANNPELKAARLRWRLA